jgi:hypothetical protein
MLKVRCTQLEAFRRFIEGEPYATEEALLESFSGVFKGNEYTRIGTGFHQFVEHGDKSVNCTLKIDDIPIIYNQRHIDVALRYKAEITPCFHEVKMMKSYNIGELIQVSGTCDVLQGLIIRDIKTKYSDLRSIEDYTRSYQWRLYCDMFEVPDFSYDVFQFVGYDKEKNGYDVSGLEIKRHDPIDCLTYSTMIDDIHKLLHEFKDYVHYRKIERYLQ